ncbi:MAG: CDP-alcohol phosphatidyltransferase family protein [Verrucomicrobiota bacterium]|jgi:phosphatidylglycerophosphate synthase|nr:CDP-alcohol phosphatidyltransferase family protein [Verrucomicrobiota bacterium]MEE2813600.1 CDP-alcohol phosphatidyltransferase family protein [Verrucomicrobiota bacterium]
MNLPNKLTTSRFFITIVFVVVMLWDSLPYNTSWAALLFFIGGMTDILDGHLARKHGLQTDFGALMDPLADKILVCAGFILLVGMKMNPQTQLGDYQFPEALAVPGRELLMPAWMVIVIVARELAITGLRLLAANKQVVLPAENIGKRKTNFQFVAVVSMLIIISYPGWGEGWVNFFGFEIAGWPWSIWFTFIATWGAVGLTLVSGVHYLWVNRDLYLKDM